MHIYEKLIQRAFKRNIHIRMILVLCRDKGYRSIGSQKQAIYGQNYFMTSEIFGIFGQIYPKFQCQKNRKLKSFLKKFGMNRIYLF